MSSVFNPFIAEIRTLYAGALPEVLAENGGGKVYEAEHIDRVPWVNIPLPYGVILLPSPELWDKRPLGSQIYTVTPQLFYVTSVDGNSGPIRDQLQLLENALRDPAHPAVNPFTTARRLQVNAPNWGDDLHPNQVFLAAGHRARAGMISFAALVGALRT